MNGYIINSKGVHVGVVLDDAVFGHKGQKLYDLKGSSIYKLNGDLVGHLLDASGEKKRLDKATDKLFPEGLPICDDRQALTGGFRARGASARARNY